MAMNESNEACNDQSLRAAVCTASPTGLTERTALNTTRDAYIFYTYVSSIRKNLLIGAKTRASYLAHLSLINRD